MGYFSNGTEGMMYEDKYCARCIHNNLERGCAVMLAHNIHNYKECNNEDSILHLLIPREGAFNGQCRMFVEGRTVYKGKLPEHLKEWADKNGVVGIE